MRGYQVVLFDGADEIGRVAYWDKPKIWRFRFLAQRAADKWNTAARGCQGAWVVRV